MEGRAVFLDRDGVLVEDKGLITQALDVRILEGVPDALRQLHSRGYCLIVVSNQAVVARGLLSEKEVVCLHGQILQMLVDKGAPLLDAFYYCPHHPNATLASFRVACECRKPRPGMLFKAAYEHDIDLWKSVMIGDRLTDIIAGSTAGCRTVLVESGAHARVPIESADIVDISVEPSFRCASLAEAASWIIRST